MILNEKDKLYRTIRRLLIIGAITIAAIFVLVIVVNITMAYREAREAREADSVIYNKHYYDEKIEEYSNELNEIKQELEDLEK